MRTRSLSPKTVPVWVLLPVNARRRYNELLAVQADLQRLSGASPYNSYRPGRPPGGDRLRYCF